MTTTFISIKEFRQNIATFAKRAKAKAGTERIIVMNRTTPLFEVTPFALDETLGTLMVSLQEAKEDVKRGRVYSHDEVIEALE
jgi:hypothetical protein